MPPAASHARPTSDRGPGRPPLPLDRIVGTALQIVDDEGADALTLRSLATRLGSSTATLYRHFTDRADLTRAVVDSLFAEVDLDDGTLVEAPWDVALLHIAESMFGVLSAHENAATLLLAELPTGPNAMSLRTRCLSVLMDRGFTPRAAVQTYATVARYVLGFGVQARAGAATHTEDGVAGLAADMSADDVIDSVGSIELAEEFRYGLELMIEGLRVRRQSDPAP